MKRRCFFVIGPESSGNRLLAEVLVASGCWGDYTCQQRFDNEEPPLNRDIVVLRSLPHANEWNVIQPTLKRLSQFNVTLLITARDWLATSFSQVRQGHVRSTREALNNIRKAYRTIFGEVNEHLLGFRIINYELLTKTPKSMLLLQSSMGLRQVELHLELRDENAKHYGWLEPTAVSPI